LNEATFWHPFFFISFIFSKNKICGKRADLLLRRFYKKVDLTILSILSSLV